MFKIKFADHVIEIKNKYRYIENLCHDYISEENPEFSIEVTDDEIHAENVDDGNWKDNYLEGLAIYRKICEKLLFDDVILFHSSVICINNKAVLFTAPSGTGKSTHTRLWREHFGDKLTMINDDKPLLHIDTNKNIITAYGTAFGGKDNIQTNTSAEAAAIVILHQAKENEIAQLTESEAFPMLLNQTYRVKTAQGVSRTLELVYKLAKLPVFSLGCNISDEAVMLVYETLKGKNLL